MFSLLSYGEVLVDFLPDDQGESYYPMAGGAPANVAVAYAKLGGKSYFAGGISRDNFGVMLSQELEKNNVSDKYIYRTEQANTAVVLVTLDPRGERSFNFYRDNTADTCYEKPQIDQINWQDISIFHFCSNTLTNTNMNNNTLYAVAQAKQHDTLVSFDVNLRHQLWNELDLLPERVDTCLQLSDLVKLSKDEAEYLAAQAKQSYQAYIENLLNLDIKLVVITDGPKPIQVLSSSFSSFIDVPAITAVDTTAAGDSFIASFIFSLTEQSKKDTLTSALLDIDKVTNAVVFAAKCGAYTCQRKGAFAALPLINDI
ncbi:MAG: carbohydrate kinase [Colwellia sp.]|nr:carbohydrate kinase [Colwellia sp.]